MFIGTVNIDETTHQFADKVYDRAQLIELGIDRGRKSRHTSAMRSTPQPCSTCGGP